MSNSVPGYTVLEDGLARHDATGTTVVIAFPSAADPALARAEAGRLAELSDPRIARLYEYVEWPEGGLRQAAVISEHVAGRTLEDLLDDAGPIGPEAALVVFQDVLLALAAAHRAGVPHRNVRAGAVVIGAGRGGAVLAGFGGPASGYFGGTVDAASTDLHAATVVFVRCVTGRTPIDAEEAADSVPDRLRSLTEAGLSTARAGSAVRLQAILERSATAYGDDWAERGRRRLDMLVDETWRTLDRGSRRGTGVLVAAALTILFTGIGGTAVLSAGRTGPAPSAPTMADTAAATATAASHVAPKSPKSPKVKRPRPSVGQAVRQPGRRPSRSARPSPTRTRTRSPSPSPSPSASTTPPDTADPTDTSEPTDLAPG